MKSFRCAFVFLLVLMPAGAYTAYASTSPETIIYKANQALVTDPKDAKAYFNRGTAQLELDNYAEAVKDLTQAISLEPKAADAYFNRGMALRLGKKNSEAIEDYSKAIELFADNWPDYFRTVPSTKGTR